MALGSLIAGRYSGSYDPPGAPAAADIGIAETGFELSMRIGKEMINESDAFGLQVIDSIYRGISDCFCQATLMEWKTGVLQATYPYSLYFAEQLPTPVLADIDDDGHNDIVLAVTTSFSLEVLYGKPDGSFEPPQRVYSSPNLNGSLEVGDANGDGHPDLVVGSRWHLHILLGRSGRSFGPPLRLRVVENPRSIALSDVNGDGFSDFAVGAPAYLASGIVLVYEGRAGGFFGHSPSTRAPGGNVSWPPAGPPTPAPSEDRRSSASDGSNW